MKDNKEYFSLDLVDEDIYPNDELKHWGILGMHWGIRRYQNEDGSLTPAGRERYLKSPSGKGNYINDNWRRAEKEVKKQLESDKRYQKFMNKKYYTWYDEEVNGDYRKDYYSILFDKTQKLLEKEYDIKINEYGNQKEDNHKINPDNPKNYPFDVKKTDLNKKNHIY